MGAAEKEKARKSKRKLYVLEVRKEEERELFFFLYRSTGLKRRFPPTSVAWKGKSVRRPALYGRTPLMNFGSRWVDSSFKNREESEDADELKHIRGRKIRRSGEVRK